MVIECEKILNRDTSRNKRELSDILNELSSKNEYEKFNPYGLIIDKLKDEGYFIEDEGLVDVTLYRGDTKNLILNIKNSDQAVKLNLYRMDNDNGSYEINAYEIKNINRNQNNTDKSKKSRRKFK